MKFNQDTTLGELLSMIGQEPHTDEEVGNLHRGLCHYLIDEIRNDRLFPREEAVKPYVQEVRKEIYDLKRRSYDLEDKVVQEMKTLSTKKIVDLIDGVIEDNLIAPQGVREQPIHGVIVKIYALKRRAFELGRDYDNLVGQLRDLKNSIRAIK